MPRRAAAPSPDGSRQRIHAAAMRLFATYGFDGVSLQRIADEAGLHKSSLFHHYRNKAELAAEVVELAMAEVVDRMQPLATDDPPRLDTLIEVVARMDALFADHPETARLLVTVMAAPEVSVLRVPIGPGMDHPVVSFFTLLLDWLSRARASGAIRELNIRQAIFNLIGVVLFYPATAGETIDIAGPEPFSPRARDVRRRELELLLRGMLAPSVLP